MAEVFLSYAREDTARARALAAALERAGRSVWWDRNIEGGSEYSVEIDDELKSADAVVVLWSSHSVGSAWVRDEAAAGRDSNRLVPVKLDQAEPPLGFRQFQTIDLSSWKGRDGPGLKTLKSAVAAKVSRSTKPGTEPAAVPTAGAPRPRWMLAAVAAAILALAALAYVWTTNRSDTAVPAIAIVRAPSGGDTAKSEALARSLSVELGSLQTGSTESFELRDTAAGNAPDVDFLVQVAASNSAQSAVADLSIVARADRSILWTGHFEKPATAQSELRLQATIRLAGVLACLMEASSSSGRQIDVATLKLYLRGCERSGDEFTEMPDPHRLSLFQQVVDRRPRFAPALARLALLEANASMDDGGSADSRRLERLARNHLLEARRLNPRLGKTYLAERNLLPRSQWRERQNILARGIEIVPDDAELHISIGFDFMQVGRMGDAVDDHRRALELDPLSPSVRSSLVQALSFSGRVVEAERELQKAEKIWPTSKLIADARYAFDLRFGDPSSALRAIRESSLGSSMAGADSGTEKFLLARIDPTAANIDKAIEAYMVRLRKEPYARGGMLLSLGGLGRTDLAYDILAHPFATEKLPHGTEMLFRPYMRGIRHDPRFMPLAARLGLVRYWTETGKWPDFCFEPDLPYDCKQEATRLQRAGQVR